MMRKREEEGEDLRLDTKVESLRGIDRNSKNWRVNKSLNHMKYCTRNFPSNVNSEHNGQRKKKLSLIQEDSKKQY